MQVPQSKGPDSGATPRSSRRSASLEREIAVAALETKIEFARIPTPTVRAHAPPMRAVPQLDGLNQRILRSNWSFAVWPDAGRRRGDDGRCNHQQPAGY